MLEETNQTGEIVERVAALDIGKAELVCCVRVPGTAGRRLQEVTTCATMTRWLLVLADRLAERGMLRPSFVPPPPIRRLQDLNATALTWSPSVLLRSSGWRSCWRTPRSS